MKLKWNVWREVEIPVHRGPEDLLKQVRRAGMHVEHWAKRVVLARPFPPREIPLKFRVARVPSGLGDSSRKLISIDEAKFVGRHHGLRLLSTEKVLALRLAYSDQPIEWMRAAVKTFVDSDESHLDLAIVNDGARLDVRTNWAFPENVFQAKHEWFWKIP